MARPIQEDLETAVASYRDAVRTRDGLRRELEQAVAHVEELKRRIERAGELVKVCESRLHASVMGLG